MSTIRGTSTAKMRSSHSAATLPSRPAAESTQPAAAPAAIPRMEVISTEIARPMKPTKSFSFPRIGLTLGASSPNMARTALRRLRGTRVAVFSRMSTATMPAIPVPPENCRSSGPSIAPSPSGLISPGIAFEIALMTRSRSSVLSPNTIVNTVKPITSAAKMENRAENATPPESIAPLETPYRASMRAIRVPFHHCSRAFSRALMAPSMAKPHRRCMFRRARRQNPRAVSTRALSGTEREICDLAPDAVQPVLVQAEMHHREGRLEIGEHLLGRAEGLFLDPVGDRDVRVIRELQLLGENAAGQGLLEPATRGLPTAQPHEHHRGDRPEGGGAGQVDHERGMVRGHGLQMVFHPRKVLGLDVRGRYQGDVRGHRLCQRIAGVHPRTGQAGGVGLRDRDGHTDPHLRPACSSGGSGQTSSSRARRSWGVLHVGRCGNVRHAGIVPQEAGIAQ